MTKLKKTYTPMGARLLVSEIITSLSLEERGAKAGLTVIVENENRPPASMGTVEAVGNDPIFTDAGVKVGDIVHFAPRAGYETSLEGFGFRMLEWQDITLLEQSVPESLDQPVSATVGRQPKLPAPPDPVPRSS